jgi:hypothetical protein
VLMMPWPLNEAVSKAVALLLCNKTVTPRPVKKALNRLERLAPNAVRTSLPQASVIPIRTMRKPHNNKETPPTRLIRMVLPLMIVTPTKG